MAGWFLATRLSGFPSSFDRIADLDDHAKSLDREIQEREEQIDELEDQAKISNRARRALQVEVARLEVEVAEFEKLVALGNAERTQLDIELKSSDNENSSLRAELDTVVSKLSRGVDQDYHCFRIEEAGLSDKTELARRVHKRLDEMGLLDREAGIVLTFGVGETTGVGIPLAETFNEEVLAHDSLRSVFGGAVLRPFWNGEPRTNKPPGSVEVNLYLWQTEDRLEVDGLRC